MNETEYLAIANTVHSNVQALAPSGYWITNDDPVMAVPPPRMEAPPSQPDDPAPDEPDDGLEPLVFTRYSPPPTAAVPVASNTPTPSPAPADPPSRTTSPPPPLARSASPLLCCHDTN